MLRVTKSYAIVYNTYILLYYSYIATAFYGLFVWFGWKDTKVCNLLVILWIFGSLNIRIETATNPCVDWCINPPHNSSKQKLHAKHKYSLLACKWFSNYSHFRVHLWMCNILIEIQLLCNISIIISIIVVIELFHVLFRKHNWIRYVVIQARGIFSW